MSPKEAEGAASFEAKMKRLEELVKHMERGDLSLEQSIASFEEGIKLVKECTAVLGEAEKKIQKLTEQGTETGTREERGDDELPF